MNKFLIVIGTRPEAIKLAPVVLELRKRDQEVTIVDTGQHEKTAEILAEFGLEANLTGRFQDHNLNNKFSLAVQYCDQAIGYFKPECVIVQGDTASALAGAIAGFYAGVKVAHVEAGLRSWNREQPHPEEVNRILIDGISDYLFCPTYKDERNLDDTLYPEQKLYTTGNTGIDALRIIAANLGKFDAPQTPQILVTAHRRENWPLMQGICLGLKNAANGNTTAKMIFIAHPNPLIQKTVRMELGGVWNISVWQPLGYTEMVDRMRKSTLVVTDSGGLQEEAAALGIPCLVLRDVTERGQGITVGAARLVGTGTVDIDREITNAIQKDWPTWDRDLYGDGHAAERIVEVLLR